MVRRVGLLGVVPAVEIRPEQGQALGGNELNGFVQALRVLAREALAEPVECLPLTKTRQGGAGSVAHLNIWLAARVLEHFQDFPPVDRLPPAETRDGCRANARVPVA